MTPLEIGKNNANLNLNVPLKQTTLQLDIMRETLFAFCTEFTLVYIVRRESKSSPSPAPRSTDHLILTFLGLVND